MANTARIRQKSPELGIRWESNMDQGMDLGWCVNATRDVLGWLRALTLDYVKAPLNL
jgi:hypothetical protein